MTRHFGTWLVGAALGLAPLAGCAGWGRSVPSGCQTCETPSLLDWWRRPKKQHPPATDSDPVIQDTLMPPPQDPPSVVPLDNPSVVTQSPSVDALPIDPPVLLPPPTNETTEAFLPPTVDLPPPITLPSAPIVATIAKPEVVHHEPLVDAMQAFIDNHQSEALQLLRKYEAPTQEVFLRLLPVLALMTQKNIDQLSAPEFASLDDQVKGLYEALRPRSKLTIGKACFCESFKAFGDYKPLPKDHAFRASTANRPGELVQTYVELRNFTWEEKNGLYVTRLGVSIELLDQKKKSVYYYRFPDAETTTQIRAMSHDYCANYTFFVPNGVAPGTYTLVIRVKDKTRTDQPREAKETLEFRVTSMLGTP